MQTSRIPLPIFFGALFLLALTLRIIFVFQWNETPYGTIPLLDARIYDDWAQSILSGNFLRSRAFYQSPLFPYVLALLYGLFGHSYLLIGFFNAFLGAATVAILSYTTLIIFGMEAALITGLLATFNRALIFYTAPIMKEPLGLFLLSLFLLALIHALRHNRIRNYIMGGALLGLCTLVRGNVIFLLPIVVGIIFYKQKATGLKNAALFTAFTFLLIAPATLHNYIVSHDFVPINYADGFNLYIGNSPIANGSNAYPPEVATDPLQEEFNVGYIARQNSDHDLKPSEVSSYWRGKALTFMQDYPWRTLVLLKKKMEAFWNSAEVFDNYDIGFIRNNFDTLIRYPIPGFWLTSCLAAFSLVAAGINRHREAKLLVAFTIAYMASVLIFYVTDRYRLPVIIFLLPLAGAALPSGWKLLQTQSYARLALATFCAAFFLFLGIQPLDNRVDLTAFDWGTLAVMSSDLHHDQETIQLMQKGFSVSPIDMGSQAYIRAAFAAEHQGNDSQAEAFLNTARHYFPDDGNVTYNIGRLKAEQGKLTEAYAALLKSQEQNPSFVLTYFSLAKIEAHNGNTLQAMGWIKRGLAIDPNNTYLLQLQTELQR